MFKGVIWAAHKIARSIFIRMKWISFFFPYQCLRLSILMFWREIAASFLSLLYVYHQNEDIHIQYLLYEFPITFLIKILDLVKNWQCNFLSLTSVPPKPAYPHFFLFNISFYECPLAPFINIYGNIDDW